MNELNKEQASELLDEWVTDALDKKLKVIKKIEDFIVDGAQRLKEDEHPSDFLSVSEIESLKEMMEDIIEGGGGLAEISELALAEYNFEYADTLKEKAWRIHDVLRYDTEYEINDVKVYFSKVKA